MELRGGVLRLKQNGDEYRAFGEQLKRLSHSGEEVDDLAKYSYSGKELDNAAIGRFINVDPVQDGLNRYLYCNNNPLCFVDPTGLGPDDATFGEKLVGAFKVFAPTFENIKNGHKENIQRQRILDNNGVSLNLKVSISSWSLAIDPMASKLKLRFNSPGGNPGEKYVKGYDIYFDEGLKIDPVEKESISHKMPIVPGVNATAGSEYNMNTDETTHKAGLEIGIDGGYLGAEAKINEHKFSEAFKDYQSGETFDSEPDKLSSNND